MTRVDIARVIIPLPAPLSSTLRSLLGRYNLADCSDSVISILVIGEVNNVLMVLEAAYSFELPRVRVDFTVG